MLTAFERGLVAHLVADWVLQNTWMARHKIQLTHPAAWVHGAIHFCGLWWAIGWTGALVLASLHVLIDTGLPLAWWMRHFKNISDPPKALVVSIWTDQVVHIAALAAWLLLFPG